MGQKVHPLGFRVGITKNHQSQWFARFHKRQYAQTVLEDRFLRETLVKMFPELLNPVLKKGPKREGTVEISPKITHIKIERGLIPYEIGIQIHAGNCNLVKSAIDQLKVQENLVHNLQKNRRYLLDLKDKYSQVSSDSTLLQKDGSTSLAQKRERQKKVTGRRKPRLTFRQSLLANMMILKKGQKITRKLQKSFSSFQKKQASLRNQSFSSNRRNANQRQRFNSLNKKPTAFFNKSVKLKTSRSFGQSPSTRAFVDFFFSKMSAKFVATLKRQMNEWNRFMKAHKQSQMEQYGTLRFAPLGYQRKWSLSRMVRLQKQPLNLLKKLLKSLQKRALRKMELMQKEFRVLGTISKIESFNYYQMIRFIKSLKQVIQQLQFEQEYQLSANSANATNGDVQKKSSSFDTSLQTQQKDEKILLKLVDTALRKKFSNIEDECRKVKFIDYLQSMVKKHRQKNVFLYLSTLSDSRKFLRKIQKSTKVQAPDLFGIDVQSIRQYPIEKQREMVQKKVAKAFKQANDKNYVDRNVQDVLLKKFLILKTVHEQNLRLTPKISIKFYSVKTKTLNTNASLVADTIVDDLEKRKAFRRVIKQAKDQLMANQKVKGVKIQVSGRLNGAEIARSEWVRAGRVPLQTLRANIDYCYKTAKTIYGIIGVKVWIYKGYTQPCRLKKPVTMNANLFQFD
jgi:ribosomal protein S3